MSGLADSTVCVVSAMRDALAEVRSYFEHSRPSQQNELLARRLLPKRVFESTLAPRHSGNGALYAVAAAIIAEKRISRGSLGLGVTELSTDGG